MASVQIFDKPMCCSTGVCGPEVDPVLPRFAADLQWLQAAGHDVARFNLAQEPAEFVANSMVQEMLNSEGIECLPLVIVDGRVTSRGEYPSRDNLALWTNTKTKPVSLPIADGGGCCSGETGCC